MTFNQALLKYIFVRSEWINHNYIGTTGSIKNINSFYYEDKKYDIILTPINMFVVSEISEIITGEVVDGAQYDENLIRTGYYAFINKDGESWAYPEYKFDHWNYDEGTENLFIQDEDNEWYSLGKKTNYKLIKQ